MSKYHKIGNKKLKYKKIGGIMKKKYLLSGITFLISLVILSGCSTTPNQEKDNNSENKMEYVTPEEIKEALDKKNNEYVLLDVRKESDYNEKHIATTYSADADPAKNGDKETTKTNLKNALKDATGSENGTNDKKYVLFCYSGASYAQAATDVLVDMGVDKSQIYTLEGGYKEWNNLGDEFTKYMVSGSEPGSIN